MPQVTRWIITFSLSISVLLTALITALIIATPGLSEPITLITHDENRITAHQFIDGTLHTIANWQIGPDSRLNPDAEMLWSPNGDQLLLQSTTTNGFGELWLMDITSGAAHNLSRNRATSLDVSWSADEQYIAVDNDREAYLQPADGSPIIPLDDSTLGADVVAVRHGAWSPMDPTQLAAVLLRGDGQARLALLRVDENTITIAQVLISGYAVIDQVRWRPDGTTLTFRLTAAPYDSYVTSRHRIIDLHMLESHPLTELGLDPIEIAWTADQQRVVMRNAGQHSAPLHIIDPASDTITATFAPGPRTRYRHMIWSPDGDIIALSRESTNICTLTLIDVDRQLTVQPLAHTPGVCHMLPAWR